MATCFFVASFTACDNQSEDLNMMEGVKAVSINVTTPETKALGDPTTGTDNKQVITVSSITIKLTGNFANEQDGIESFISDESKTALEKVSEYTFWDVINVSQVEAFINYSDGTIHTTTSAAETAKGVNVACYGKSETFTAGEAVTNNGKKYTLYNSEITVLPAVARIEASNISIKDYNPSTSAFKEIKFSGLFLNNVCINGDISTRIGTNVENNTNHDAAAFLATAKTSQLGDWQSTLTQYVNGTKYPTESGKCYAYNFFMPANATVAHNPILTIAFEECISQHVMPPLASQRFAIVKAYKVSGEAVTFTPGNIYRITNLEILDQNIGGPEDPEHIAVKATVIVTPWNIQDVTVEWR